MTAERCQAAQVDRPLVPRCSRSQSVRRVGGERRRWITVAPGSRFAIAIAAANYEISILMDDLSLVASALAMRNVKSAI